MPRRVGVGLAVKKAIGIPDVAELRLKVRCYWASALAGMPPVRLEASSGSNIPFPTPTRAINNERTIRNSEPMGRRGGRAGLFIGSHPYCSHALTRSYEASGEAVQFANAVSYTHFGQEMRADPPRQNAPRSGGLLRHESHLRIGPDDKDRNLRRTHGQMRWG